jgi:hypothetical protein
MGETMGELVGRIARLKYEAEKAARSGNHAGADSCRKKARQLENKRRTWERGEPWESGGD